MKYKLFGICKRGQKTFKYQPVFFQKMKTLEVYIQKQIDKYGDNYSYCIQSIDFDKTLNSEVL